VGCDGGAAGFAYALFMVVSDCWFGALPRLFFHEAAEQEASNTEGAGYDTYIRPVIAFSSLGFFNDPLLSDLLKLNRVELAGVIIHELFHRTYFLPSDVMFDESAATYIGNRGAIDYFKATEGPNSRDTDAARGMLESDFKFAHFLDAQSARLNTLYTANLPQDELLKRRKVLFAEISSDYARQKRMLSGLDRFDLDKTPINNAVLIDYLIYFHDFDNFAALERMHHGDLRATIHSIIELAKNNSEEPFFAIWQATHGTHATTTVSSPSTSR
jgi:predicted aminopeptidase